MRLDPDAGFSRRDLYEDEHEAFRESFRRFLEREIVPHHPAWEAERIVPRQTWRRAGELGFLGLAVPERHGGAGAVDFRFNAVIGEEAQRSGVASFGVGITNHNDVCLPYLIEHTTEEQRQRWLPGTVSGELLTAIAMTEPGTGSDLGAIKTRGVSDGEGWVVNGSKTFISCGASADLVLAAVRTDSTERHRGLTMMVVERGMPGFSVGGRVEKIGLHAQDTAELVFEEVRVPAENVLGAPGEGFALLVSNLPRERMTIAIAAIAAARAGLAETIDYVENRRAFGQRVADFQASRFALAEAYADVEVGQAYLDRSLRSLGQGLLSAEQAAIAKLWATEMQGRVIDRCLQLHGGYGYTADYRIGRRYADARVTRLYGGTSEIMKEIVGRALTRS